MLWFKEGRGRGPLAAASIPRTCARHRRAHTQQPCRAHAIYGWHAAAACQQTQVIRATQKCNGCGGFVSTPPARTACCLTLPPADYVPNTDIAAELRHTLHRATHTTPHHAIYITPRPHCTVPHYTCHAVPHTQRHTHTTPHAIPWHTARNTVSHTPRHTYHAAPTLHRAALHMSRRATHTQRHTHTTPHTHNAARNTAPYCTQYRAALHMSRRVPHTHTQRRTQYRGTLHAIPRRTTHVTPCHTHNATHTHTHNAARNTVAHCTQYRVAHTTPYISRRAILHRAALHMSRRATHTHNAARNTVAHCTQYRVAHTTPYISRRAILHAIPWHTLHAIPWHTLHRTTHPVPY